MADKPLWQGRLSGQLARDFVALNASIDVDKRLWPQDIKTNRAYLKALNRAKLVDAGEYKTISAALDDLENDFKAGKVDFRHDLEDIHMHIEAALTEKAGAMAGKIHTGRSRNDQVATDLRLYVKDAIDAVGEGLKSLLAALADRAEETRDLLFPAYTHLQRAQPTVFGHWFMAYAAMFQRDLARFRFAQKQADACPLGLGACTGNPFDVDRTFLMQELGFGDLCRNSLDGVSDRDYVLDFLYAAACLFIHISRLAEDLILYASSEFRFVSIADDLSTGSSMMPQKRNPDSLELARGKTGRVMGNLVTLFTIVKGLPLTYNKDLQEDKEPLFDSVDTVLSVLPMIREIVATLTIHQTHCADALTGGFLEATAVADYLTLKGIPFRQAYKLTGRIVHDLASAGRRFQDLSVEEWRAYDPVFDQAIQSAIQPGAIAAARNRIGGTAPTQVAHEIERLRTALPSL